MMSEGGLSNAQLGSIDETETLKYRLPFHESEEASFGDSNGQSYADK